MGQIVVPIPELSMFGEQKEKIFFNYYLGYNNLK